MLPEHLKHPWRSSICRTFRLLFTTMSSMYTSTVHLILSWNILVIIHWYVAPAFLTQRTNFKFWFLNTTTSEDLNFSPKLCSNLGFSNHSMWVTPFLPFLQKDVLISWFLRSTIGSSFCFCSFCEIRGNHATHQLNLLK